MGRRLIVGFRFVGKSITSIKSLHPFGSKYPRSKCSKSVITKHYHKKSLNRTLGITIPINDQRNPHSAWRRSIVAELVAGMVTPNNSHGCFGLLKTYALLKAPLLWLATLKS
jgi:hypothetical protein